MKSPNRQIQSSVVRHLIDQSHIGRDFYLLLTLATLITTLGLIVNNTAIVIGGMLIAPLLSPILALGLGVVTTNHKSLARSLIAIGKSGFMVLLLSFLTALIVGVTDSQNIEIMQRIQPTLPYIYIAFLSGAAASYAWAKPKLSATLPGIAVVVALLPPLCVTGIGLSIFSRQIVTGSFQLFLVNLLGITASSTVVFSLLGFHDMQQIEEAEIEKEEQEQVADQADPILD